MSRSSSRGHGPARNTRPPVHPLERAQTLRLSAPQRPTRGAGQPPAAAPDPARRQDQLSANPPGKESRDPDKDRKLDRIEEVTSRFPHRCFAFDQFGPLSIRPCHGATWAPQTKPTRLPATYHRTHGIRYFHGCYSLGDDQLWGVVRRRKGGDHTLAALRSIRARGSLTGAAVTTSGRSGRSWAGCGQSLSTARDQHQPASSRAIAVFATTGSLWRASNRTRRACSRRLARSPRGHERQHRPCPGGGVTPRWAGSGVGGARRLRSAGGERGRCRS